MYQYKEENIKFVLFDYNGKKMLNTKSPAKLTIVEITNLPYKYLLLIKLKYLLKSIKIH